jgi:hypothetical protein
LKRLIIVFLILISKGTPAQANAATIQSYRLAIHSSIDGFPGQAFRRSAGKFTLINFYGKPIQIYFIGTLHDQVETQSPGSFSILPAEEEFIDRHLSRVKNPRLKIFAVEQGLRSETRNRIDPIVVAAAEMFDKNLANSIRANMLNADRNSMDMNEFSRKARRYGGTFNIDLVDHQSLFDYYLTTRGTEAALKALLSRMNALKVPIESVPTLLEQTLIQLGQVDGEILKQAQELASSFYSKFNNNLDPLFQHKLEHHDLSPNKVRDEFMAREILKFNSDGVIITHTAHSLGYLRFLADRITQFEPEPPEVSRHRLSLLKAMPQNMREFYLKELEKEPTFIRDLSPLLIVPIGPCENLIRNL